MSVDLVCADLGKACSARALFRYQGGKQRMCKRLVGLFSSDMRRYFEPFVGAASVYLECSNRGFRGPAFLGDWNPDVVNAHQVVAADPGGFEGAYRVHVERHGRAYFYALRDRDAAGWTAVERAARTVYLAKAAFHGLLRVNARGRVVSTYGTGELSRVLLDVTRIRRASEAFRRADIRHADFGWVESMAEEGDLVFIDSPYVGGNVAYVADGFCEDDHLRLCRMCRALDAKGVRFVATNSDRPEVHEMYAGFRLLSIPPAPAIGRGGAGRQPVGELVITNFEPGKEAAEFEAAA